MCDKKIIAITGLARSGKDTTAEYVFRLINDKYNVGKFALAKELKKELYQYIDLDYDDIEYMKNNNIPAEFKYTKKDFPYLKDAIYENNTINVRKALQLLGDYIRSNDSDYFTKKTINLIETTNKDISIITDLRFVNEHDYLKKYYGSCITVIKIKKDIDTSNAIYDHASEKEVLKITEDYTIINNGTLEELEVRISKLLKEILGWNI